MPDGQPPPLSFDDDRDLFAVPSKPPSPPATRRDDYQTSVDAAATVAKAQATIRDAVLAHALAAGPEGFTDDDLVQLSPGTPESSWRKRRTELLQEGWVVQTDRERVNRFGNKETVWVHRDHVLQPPALRSRQHKPKPDEVEAAFLTIDRWARQMKHEGRLFVGELETAIATLKAR